MRQKGNDYPMNKPTALVIEDDPMLSDVFCLTLKANFDPLPILDGQLALQHLATNSADLIVLDMNLPGASGHEILNYIHSQEHLNRVKIILSTADALQADLFANQADLVLLKPVSPAQLRELSLRLIPVDKT